MAATITNADPRTADDRKPSRKWHYISFEVEGSDTAPITEVIAEESNLRSAKGYRLHTVHFYGTQRVKATLVFERRLRRPRKRKAAETVPEATASQAAAEPTREP